MTPLIASIVVLLSFCNADPIGEGRLQIQLPEGRIVGGHSAEPDEYPYQVSLQTKFLWIKAHICGGSLLNTHWVLTAAHCLSESLIIGLLPMEAMAGAHDVNYPSYSTQISRVEKRITHPLYAGGVGPNDIAVLRLKYPFVYTKSVQPIRLPSRHAKFESRSVMTLTGWGLLRTSFWPDMPTALQEVQVPILSYKECYDAIELLKDYPEEPNPLDRESNICTGPLHSGVAACNGDSGGPLVHLQAPSEDGQDDSDNDVVTVDSNANNANITSNLDEERSHTHKPHLDHPYMIRPKPEKIDLKQAPVIVGVVSWGMTPCGSDGAPTVYTNVANYLDFINYHIIH